MHTIGRDSVESRLRDEIKTLTERNSDLLNAVKDFLPYAVWSRADALQAAEDPLTLFADAGVGGTLGCVECLSILTLTRRFT